MDLIPKFWAELSIYWKQIVIWLELFSIVGVEDNKNQFLLANQNPVYRKHVCVSSQSKCQLDFFK